MKKYLSFFLALTFLFGITVLPALAEGAHTITVQITGNGTVTPNEGGSALVNDGETATFTCTPAEDYYVSAISFNGNSVIVNQSGQYTTEPVTADGTLSVTFSEKVAERSVSTFSNVFYSGLAQSITFGTVAQAKGYDVLEYGILCSASDSNPTLDTPDVIKCPAKTPFNAKGQYGIELKNLLQTLPSSYYTRAYAIYGQNGEAAEPVYGSLSAQVDEVSFYPVTDIRYTGPVSTVNPDFDTTPVLIKKFKNGETLYPNAAVLKCDNLMPQYSGMPVISSFNPVAGTTPSDIKSAWYGSKGYKWLTFTIHKSATIRVFSEGVITPLKEAGYGYGYTQETTTENGGFYFSRLNSDWPNAEQSKMTHMYSRHFEVTPGEPQVIELPNAQNMASNKWGYVVMIDFDEPITPVIRPEITNVTYKGPEADGFDGTVRQGTLENGVPMYTNYTAVSAENLSGELKGLPYLYTANPVAGSAPQTVKDAWGNKLISWYTFDINKSATVCIYTDGASLEYGSDGYTKETSTTPYFQKKNNTEYKNMTTRYVKHFDVPEGETVTVSVPNAPWYGTTKWGHLVTVQFDQ